jgi:DNA-directed RNA polymerase specialized sigma24 family protein
LRDVFVLCLLEEQRVPEVAALLQLPENTVYSRIRLVREAFHAALARTTEA